MAKASTKVDATPRGDRSAPLARAEVLGKAIRARLADELGAALERRPPSELRLAGALRALAPFSLELRTVMASAAEVMARRRSFDRALYCACLRALAEAEDRRAAAIVAGALSAKGAGGAATLGAACSVKDPSLAAVLSKLAASRQSHIAFAAETARVARGESNGGHLLAIAPMIKEVHRIALCLELFVPMARAKPMPVAIAPALGVLREAERHLGRWLVLAEVAARAGDKMPCDDASARAIRGPQSSRGAWSLVAWALADAVADARGAARPAPCSTRPTVETVARLSDRPSADRDPTFLFRLAAARAPAVRPMLEALLRGASTPVVKVGHGPIADGIALRAAFFLARDHGRDDLRAAVACLAMNPRREELRGLCAAALWDLGMTDEALAVADELAVSRLVGNAAWAALVRARVRGAGCGPLLLSETTFRWMHWGWLA